MSIAAMSTLLKDRYGLSETQIGLTFIANGAGSMIGTLVTGKILDIDYRHIQEKHDAQITRSRHAAGPGIRHCETSIDGFPLEKARLRLVPIFSVLQCVSILIFGWTVQYHNHVHISVPIVSTFITGWTAISIQSVIMTYLVDVFSDQSAAASASLNLARCLIAAGGTSLIMPIVNGLDVGLAFTICLAAQVLSLLCAGVQWRYGGRWRREAALRLNVSSNG